MKHYVDKNTKEIFAYEDDGSQDHLIKDGLAPISDEELVELRAPEETVIIAQKVQEAKRYLSDTDFKMIPDYEPKEGEDLEAIRLKRKEAREFIRENKND